MFLHYVYTDNRGYPEVILGILAFCGLAAMPLVVVAADPLEMGYRQMYNLNFEGAHRTFRDFQRANPDDPMGPVSDAAADLFYEFDRLKVLHSEFFVENHSFLNAKRLPADPKVKADFEAALLKTKQLAAAMLQKRPGAQKALLANVIGMALHADYEALIEKQNWQALTEVKQARIDADALLKKYPDCYDAYLAVGVENYLLSQKAAPLRMFLRMTGAETDKQIGMQKLRLVAQKGHYLKPYAKILLAIAALRDQNPNEAKHLLQELAIQFPQNDLFQQELKKLG